MKKYICKFLNVFMWLLDKINKKSYIKLYPRYLNWLGVQIDKDNYEHTWISPSIFLDSSRYELIKIGNKVTISFDVAILVHDYSIVHAARKISKRVSDIIYRAVEIGDNVFIGARTVILPGTVIGSNTIVGAGSVVKGNLKENSVYAGNPAKYICSVDDYIRKNKQLLK